MYFDRAQCGPSKHNSCFPCDTPMKKLLYPLLFALLACLALRADDDTDNWLQNGDFANGADHWRGDGRTPADMAPDDPFAKPDPLLSSGLIIPLKDRQWTKVTQNFRTKASELVLVIKYILSPGLTFSDQDDDYNNIPKQIDNNIYGPFNLSKHQCMALFTDFGNGAKGQYIYWVPTLGSSEVQTLTHRVTNFSQLEDEVVTIAFPPGQGNVILKSVSLLGQ